MSFMIHFISDYSPLYYFKHNFMLLVLIFFSIFLALSVYMPSLSLFFFFFWFGLVFCFFLFFFSSFFFFSSMLFLNFCAQVLCFDTLKRSLL